MPSSDDSEICTGLSRDVPGSGSFETCGLSILDNPILDKFCFIIPANFCPLYISNKLLRYLCSVILNHLMKKIHKSVLKIFIKTVFKFFGLMKTFPNYLHSFWVETLIVCYSLKYLLLGCDAFELFLDFSCYSATRYVNHLVNLGWYRKQHTRFHIADSPQIELIIFCQSRTKVDVSWERLF